MAARFPSWQTTFIIDATHWHPGESRPQRRAVATVQIRARHDGALLVTVTNGTTAPEVLMVAPGEASALMRIQELLFAHEPPSRPRRERRTMP